MAEELQKDKVTRGQALWMGVGGGLMGATLTIPPLVYVLNPAIKQKFGEGSDIPDDWILAGSVFEIPKESVKVYRVEFPQKQTYDGGGEILGEGELIIAVLMSWREGKMPALLEGRGRAELSESETEELAGDLNVFANHCSHLGCPVRWFPERREILCPCHGGIFDINGSHVGGPPPRDLWPFAFKVRRNGDIYIKHEFPGPGTRPYVV